MKSIIIVTMATLLSCLPSSGWSASYDIDGIWENARTKVSLMVKTTASGIKVQRINKNRWYYYQELRSDQFRDDEGNTYYLIDQHTLEWEDASGDKRIRFYKKGDSSQSNVRQSESRQNSKTYIDRNHYNDRGKSRRRGNIQVNPDFLEGRWLNQHTGQTIRVRGKRNSILVRTRKTGWVRFHQDRAKTFVDNQGNKYIFDRGDLTYLSRRNDFRMRFKKY